MNQRMDGSILSCHASGYAVNTGGSAFPTASVCLPNAPLGLPLHSYESNRRTSPVPQTSSRT